MFMCTISKLAGGVPDTKRALELPILPRPSVTIHPLTTTMTLGNTVLVTCIIKMPITGHMGVYTKPDVIWYKNGNVLKKEKGKIATA